MSSVINASEVADVCDRAIRSGAGLDSVFEISKESRTTENGTVYMDLYYCNDGLRRKLVVRVEDKHIGEIQPVEKESSTRKSKWEKKPRGSMNATVNVRKYNTNITSNTVEDYSNEIKSDYFRMIEHLEKFYINKMSNLFKDVKITPLIQWTAKADSRNNIDLINPIRRDPIRFNDFRTPKFYDLDTKDELKIDGKCITNENVHKAIKSKSDILAIIHLDSICNSKMGISIPSYIESIAVRPPILSSAVNNLFDT